MRGPLPTLPLAVLLALAGCGGGGSAAPPPPAPSADPVPSADPAPAARTELAARAAAAQDLVGVTVYTLTTPGREDRTVLVVRAADGGWRVDIPGGGLGGTADVSIVATADGRFHCALATPPERGECVPVDGELTAAADPRVQHVFTDWLDVLTDRSAAVAVARTDPPAGVAGQCFAVQPSSASLLPPLDAGSYCFDADGTLTGARLELGELTLTGADRTAPPSVDLPGAVVPGGEPLPTAAPTPSPSPTPSRR